MYEPPARLRQRYDEASRQSGLYTDPDATALRENPIQQLWRQHMLAELARQRGDYDEGTFVIIAPKLNHRVHRAIGRYRTHLADGEGRTRFDAITLKAFVEAIRTGGLTQPPIGCTTATATSATSTPSSSS